MIEVKDSELDGKGLYSTEFIPKWSKFSFVKSDVSVLEDFAIKDHCATCMSRNSILISCPVCSIAKYCSESCMENDLICHKYECTWYKTVFSSISSETKEINIPSRSQRFLMRFVSFLESKCSSIELKPESNLVDNCSLVSQEKLDLWRSEIVEILSILPDFASKNDSDDLLRFCGILKSNSFKMRRKDSGDIFGGQLIELHSRINNDCSPNCISSLDGNVSFLIALRDILPGEEITISYFDSSLPRKMRQKYLKDNFFFDCKCSLCSTDEFNIPEAFRTANICSCNKIIYEPTDICKFCGASFEYICFDQILREFPTLSSIEKMNTLKKLQKQCGECHWINNKLADIIITEFCTDSEYTKEIPSLLIDFDTGYIKGSSTISNPFILLIRYEYSLALINRHPELYNIGLMIASNYLKLSVKLKGVDDEISQVFANLAVKWSSYLKNIPKQ